MKKAFTMIELIFVIVILGILSAIAIPRLAATRDDAEISKAAMNLSVLILDLSGYYTTQGEWHNGGIKEMTNVPAEPVSGNIYSAELTAAGKKCIKTTLDTANSTLKIEGGTNMSDPLCAKILAVPSIKNITDHNDGKIHVPGKSMVF